MRSDVQRIWIGAPLRRHQVGAAWFIFNERVTRLITILDYGMGNIRSVQKAVEFLGHECRVSDSLAGTTKLILPGVGAFGAAMSALKPVKADILDFAKAGGPLLGICLGQQLLFECSEEMGEHVGLGLISGRVRYLPSLPRLKIPHIGWCSVSYRRSSGLGIGGIEGEEVYFVHSLYTDCEDERDVVASATYGVEFPAAVQKGNLWGAQYHPEKSGPVGLRMLKNFLEC